MSNSTPATKKRKATVEPDSDQGNISPADTSAPALVASSSQMLGFKFADKIEQSPGWPQGPLSTFATASIVTLKVGNTNTGISSFQVHESLLCNVEFFKAALQEGFKEASTRVIEMPENDPVVTASLVQFLYYGDYTGPLPVTPEVTNPQNGMIKQNIYGPKLYNARVLALGEKYRYEGLYQKAAAKMCTTRHYFYSGSTMEVNGSFLQYLIHIYEMSGPTSMLRIPGANRPQINTPPKPIKWNFPQAVSWVGKMHNDVEQRKVLEYVFRRCPELAEDLFCFIGKGYVDSLNANDLFNVTSKSRLAKGRPLPNLYVKGSPIIY